MWHSVKIKSSVCVHGDEGGSLIFGICWTLKELCGSEEEELSGCDAHIHGWFGIDAKKENIT